MQVAQLYHETFQKLTDAGIEDAQSNTDQLLGFCLGLTRSQLFLRSGQELTKSQLELCRKLVMRRLAREPLQYITGTREFWSLDFTVSPAVLIPRPETEFLIEQVIQTIKESGYRGGTILDMCTGSGVIAVILARELYKPRIIAVDCSPAALEVAALNIARYEKENEVMLLCADLFSAFLPQYRFEMIVANPPYICIGDLAGLQSEVRKWEPEKALIAGDEGLDIIKNMAEDIPRYLLPGGWIFIEIGAGQEDSVHEIFAGHKSGAYDCVSIIHDWSKRPRVLRARRNEEYFDGQVDY
jgi:release factor glutamine methyltransferase